MKKTLLKNVLRMIQTTKSRFLSLTAIVCIGVAFFVGVSSSSTMMASSVDVYDDAYQLKDITIYSNYGFNDEDIKSIKALDDVDIVETSKFVDVIADIHEFSLVSRVHSFVNKQEINQFVLQEGRLPVNSHEILAEKGGDLSSYFQIGDTVTFRRPDNDLDTFLYDEEYTVVGLIDTPLYMNQSRESSTLQNKSLETYFYVLEEAFALDVYTELNAVSYQAQALDAFSDEYDDFTDALKQEIEDISKQRESVEYERIKEEAMQEYRDGLKEYQDNYDAYLEEIADARVQIADGIKELNDGEAELLEQTRTLQQAQSALNQTKSEKDKKLQEAAAIIAEAKSSLIAQQSQMSELQDNYNTLCSTYNALNSQMTSLSLLAQNVSLLPQDSMMIDFVAIIPGIEEIDPLYEEHTVEQFLEVVNATSNQVSQGLTQVSTHLNEIETNLYPNLSASEVETLDNLQRQTQENLNQIAEIEKNEETVTRLITLLQNYDIQAIMQDADILQWFVNEELSLETLNADVLQQYLESYASQKSKLLHENLEIQTKKQNIYQTYLDNTVNQINAGLETVLVNEASYEEGLATYQKEIQSAQKQIDDGWTQINDARATISEGRQEIQNSQNELNESIVEAEKEFAKAKEELEDAKETIDALEAGAWTVLNRKQHYASVTFDATVDQMAAIGRIFPLFFLMVAVLVCLTTMSRTISEQRGEIGVLRALGYSRMQCMMKYILYALSATMIGEILGVILGIFTFPIIIYNTWRLMYNLPDLKITLDWVLILSTMLAFILVMSGTTWFTAHEDMKEVSASLLRPKTPKLGKKILLEKVPFIWKRTPFSWKVTIRNLFRYKRRFIMTVIGIAGCSALLVTGFGIRDSITGMVDLHFNEILKYDSYLNVVETANRSELLELQKVLNTEVKDSLMIHGYQSNYLDLNENSQSITVQIFENDKQVQSYYNLRDRKTHTSISLPDQGVIIDEKLSELLEVEVGDTIRIEGEDGRVRAVIVSDICEFYINHICMMSEDYYAYVFGDEAMYTTFLIKEGDTPISQLDLDTDIVESMTTFSDSLRSFDHMISSLSIIVWTIIVSSMLLAFVVLGNLINVNISERSREIATLKVLGFHRNEVQSYIFKENYVLTVVGALVGMPLGRWLHRTIMTTVEMDYVMFGRQVNFLSYLLAIFLTVLFSVIVTIFMKKILHRIQMVESLKSVE